MKENNKIHSIHFRLDSKHKQWLDLLIENSYSTVSSYFNKQIRKQIKIYAAEKAMERGRNFASDNFGISDNIRQAIKTKKDIKGLFGSEENEETFLSSWAHEALKEAQNLAIKLDINEDDIFEVLDDKLSDLLCEKNKFTIYEGRLMVRTVTKKVEYPKSDSGKVNILSAVEYNLEEVEYAHKKEEGENALK